MLLEMYLDQTPQTERTLMGLIQKSLMDADDEDDQIMETNRMQDPTGLRVVTETGKIFHVTINEIH